MLGLTGRVVCDVTEHSIHSVLSLAFWNPPQNSSFPGKNRCLWGSMSIQIWPKITYIFHLKNITSIYMNINLFPSLLLKQGPKIRNPPQGFAKKISQVIPRSHPVLGSHHDGRIGSIHAATKAGISLAKGVFPQKSLVFFATY